MKSKIIKIAIFSIIFTVLLLGLILNEVDVFLIGLIVFIFSISIAGYILIPLLKEHKQSDDVAFSNEVPKNINSLKKISTKNHYYDNGTFYIINKEQKVIAIPFSDIIKIKHTLTKVNNRRYWKVTATYKGKTVDFRFRHNYTLWNKNFPKFLAELKRLNPNAEVGKFNLWTM